MVAKTCHHVGSQTRSFVVAAVVVDNRKAHSSPSSHSMSSSQEGDIVKAPDKGDVMETETEEAPPPADAVGGQPSKDEGGEAPAAAKDDEEMEDAPTAKDHPPAAAAAVVATSKVAAVEKAPPPAAKGAAAAPPVAKTATAPTEKTTAIAPAAAAASAAIQPPPPLPAAPVYKPALVNLNEWDKTWEEQYERRKRRKVIPDTLPARTIGRADDPIRLAAGPCTCKGPCHLNDLCPCNHGGLFCTETCRCGRACENNVPYAESRHRALVQAIQQGHRPVVHECCPCAPACEAVVSAYHRRRRLLLLQCGQRLIVIYPHTLFLSF